jgi:cytochrome c
MLLSSALLLCVLHVATSTTPSTRCFARGLTRRGGADTPPSEALDPRIPATEALVERAVELLAAEGAAAYDALREEDTEYFHDSTYVFVYSADGVVQFNAASPQKEGHDVKGAVDSNGKAFHDELIAAGMNSADGGWVSYAWPRPGETEPSEKWTFARRCEVDGVDCVVLSGFYQ